MSGGKVLQMGSPEEIYQRPSNVQVADFIGQMNFIEASVLEANGEAATIEAAGLGKVEVATNAEYATGGGKVVVAVRPEKLVVTAERPADSDNAVQGRVRNIAYLGDRRHYYVSVDGREQPLAVAAQEMRMTTDPSLGEGKDVWLSWGNDSLVLLKAE